MERAAIRAHKRPKERAAQWPPSRCLVSAIAVYAAALIAVVDSPFNVSLGLLDDPRHIAPKVELVPPCVDCRHPLAGMREQSADLFERVACPIQDRCGGSPKVMRRPPLHAEALNEALGCFMQLVSTRKFKQP